MCKISWNVEALFLTINIFPKGDIAAIEPDKTEPPGRRRKFRKRRRQPGVSRFVLPLFLNTTPSAPYKTEQAFRAPQAFGNTHLEHGTIFSGMSSQKSDTLLS